MSGGYYRRRSKREEATIRRYRENVAMEPGDDELLHPCPVCDTMMEDDWIATADGDVRQAICPECGWPPIVPWSVEGWRDEWQGKTADWKRYAR